MDKIVKKSILYAVYNYLKERGYKKFKASLLNIESPQKLVENQSGAVFEPDMTAMHNENSYIFEIEMGNSVDNNKEEFIKKCKVFEKYASEHNGKLYLIVPVEQFDTIIKEVKKARLENIGILQVQAS